MTLQPQDFWSRRKARVAQEAEEDAARMAEAAAIAEGPDTDNMSDPEILAHFDLPDPDTLSLGDDVKGFMAKAVPEHLRRRALRKLWRTNPVLACVDGLNDYDGDFTDAAMVKTGMKTAYQVGKGMLAHLQEMDRQAEMACAVDPDQAHTPDKGEDDMVTPENAAENAADMVAENAPENGAEDTVAEMTNTEDMAPTTPRPRMRLAFVENPQAQVQA